jgi:hypothetical protein
MPSAEAPTNDLSCLAAGLAIDHLRGSKQTLIRGRQRNLDATGKPDRLADLLIGASDGHLEG